MSQTWHDVAAESDVIADEVLAADAAGLPIALFRVEGEVFALHDLCSHGHARLSDGFVEDDCVECPLHQGMVDIRTGAPRAAPINMPVKTYAVRIRDGRVEVAIPA